MDSLVLILLGGSFDGNTREGHYPQSFSSAWKSALWQVSGIGQINSHRKEGREETVAFLLPKLTF
jgi:hypothetical protein